MSVLVCGLPGPQQRRKLILLGPGVQNGFSYTWYGTPQGSGEVKYHQLASYATPLLRMRCTSYWSAQLSRVPCREMLLSQSTREMLPPPYTVCLHLLSKPNNRSTLQKERLTIDSRGEGLETHAWDSVQFRPIRVSPTPTQCCSGN